MYYIYDRLMYQLKFSILINYLPLLTIKPGDVLYFKCFFKCAFQLTYCNRRNDFLSFIMSSVTQITVMLDSVLCCKTVAYFLGMSITSWPLKRVCYFQINYHNQSGCKLYQLLEIAPFEIVMFYIVMRQCVLELNK